MLTTTYGSITGAMISCDKKWDPDHGFAVMLRTHEAFNAREIYTTDRRSGMKWFVQAGPWRVVHLGQVGRVQVGTYLK